MPSVGAARGTQRSRPTQREDEGRLTQAIVALASQYGRYGYRRITALLVRAGWRVGKDRVERIWRRERLKVPKRQNPGTRLWLNDGSCVRLRPTHAGHMWSYDFVSARTPDGRIVLILNLIDESTRECLLIRAELLPLPHGDAGTRRDARRIHYAPEGSVSPVITSEGIDPDIR